MTASEDIDALAGEYVLGTLELDERTTVAARRLREPILDAAIRDWELRLAPLNSLTPDIDPPRGLIEKINQLIDAGSRPAANIIEIDQLRQSLARWRRRAIAASGIAASLVLAIGLRETAFRPEPQRYVAVFQKDDVLPSFYLTIDLKTRELTVRPVDAQRQPGKTYQLWIASEQLGPAPRSLGLVEEDLRPTRKQLLDFEPQLLQRATFGVSLEPAGGSPTGRPTSPALHAKLLPVSN